MPTPLNPGTAGFINDEGQTVLVSSADPLPTVADGMALEEGGNLDALVAAIGSPADAAWSGTGNGTVISILKAIAANTAGP